MIRISLGILCFILSIGNHLQAQTCINDTSFTDILFVIDNSMSIDETEYLSFEQIILSTIQKVQAQCNKSQVGVVHYGGPQGDSTTVEYDLANNNVISSIERQYCITPGCDGGDDLNKAMGNIIDHFADGSLNRNSDNRLAIVIFTDANGSLTNCGPFVNCSVIVPYTNVDILKSAPYNADVTVVGISSLANQSALAVYASPGGNYVGSLRSPDCSSTVDGCNTPRKYIQIEFTSELNSTSDSISSFVDCSFIINDGLAVITSADTTICSNFGGRASISAQAIAGQAPFVYEWDNLLGFGNTKTVNPTMTTTYTVTITDANNCEIIEMITVTADNMCCDPDYAVDISGNLSICENTGDATTITASTSFGTNPITYVWNNGLGNNPVQTVSPTVPTTYIVIATDAANCVVMDSVIVTPITCAGVCDAFAGNPLPAQFICSENGTYEFTSDPNTNMIIPSGYEIIYILSDSDLKIVDYSIGPKNFRTETSGLFRVHTLIAEVSDRSSEDFLDLSIITLNQSSLFVIVNCMVDHGICADFDFAGRPTVALTQGDILCLNVENSINLCGDGIDNDGDGLVDCTDPECGDFSICAESSLIACNDLYDNDGDGLLDCDDPDCFQFNICFEQEEKCNDGIDNDGDGLIDCMDDSCFNSSDCFENSPITCVDGIDNDGDGLVDCQEASCQRFIVCSEYDIAACTDGKDNDFDGLVDCADRDCQLILNNICAPNESSLSLCGDGIDNDGDGLMDCEDSDCGFLALKALESEISQYLEIVHASCPLNNSGSVKIIGGLASSSYQYSIVGKTMQDDFTFVNLDSGTYELEIMTLTNCVLLTTIIINGDDCTENCSDGIDNDGDGLLDCEDPDCGITGINGSINLVNPTCPANDNGSVDITGLQDGISYSFSIDNGATNQDSPVFNDLIPGTYEVMVMANRTCSYSETITLTEEVCLEICNNGIDDDNDGLTDCADGDCGVIGFEGQIDSDEATCPLLDNGKITISGQFPNVSYTYSIDSGRVFQESSEFLDLLPGEYEVIIKTGDNCEFSTSIMVEAIYCEEICGDGIDQDGDGLEDCDDPHCGLTGIIDDIVVTNPSCPTNGNGSISIGGQLDPIEYTYSINGGESFDTTRMFSGLNPGMYSVTIITAAGCSYETEVALEGSSCSEICDNDIDDDGDGLIDCADGDCGVLIFDGAILVTDDGCSAESTGFIEISGQSDGVNYMYSIDGGDSFVPFREFEGLDPGLYTVVIATEDGCSYTKVVTVSSDICIELCDNGIDDDGDGLVDCADGDCGILGFESGVTVTNINCFTSNSGSISISGQLEGLTYSYSINAGQTFVETSSFDSLFAGSYFIIVTTSDGCEYRAQVVIESPSCNEICDNGIDDDGDGLVDCDDGECGLFGLEESITSTNVNCSDDNSGEILIRGQVEAISYTYSINAGQTFQESGDFTGLAAGSYFIIVRTADGCDYSQQLVLEKEECPEICDNGIDDDGDGLVDCADGDCGVLTFDGAILVTDDGCSADNTGFIEISGQSDGVTYMYSINGGQTFESFREFEDLDTGFYEVVVSTGEGCEYRETIYIDSDQCDEICDNGIDDDGDGIIDCADGDCGVLGFEGRLTTTNVNCMDSTSGQILIVGQTPGIEYTYQLSEGIGVQDSGTFSNLSEGTYSVVIITDAGCEYTEEVIIAKDQCIEVEICDNGVDDDGDGLIDCLDSDCGLEAMDFTLDVLSPTCPENNNGQLNVSSDQVLDGFAFSINNGITFQDSTLFTGLSVETGSGTQMYSLVIENSFGCGVTIEVPITGEDCSSESTVTAEICDNGVDDDGDGLIDCADGDCFSEDVLTPVIVNSTCPDNDNGAIIYDAPSSGLLFSLDGQIFQELALFDNLDAGDYQLYIQNANGCIEIMDVTIVPEDDCAETPGLSSEVDVNLRVILQGPYSPVNGSMSAHLNQLGYLPGQNPTTFFGIAAEAGQPYNEAPWFYDGIEGLPPMNGEQTIPDDLYTDDVVDWLLVSFRSESTKSSQFWRGAALLHADGGVELISKPTIDILDQKEFYIVIEHRNHLPAMTPYKVGIVKDEVAYDFSKSDSYTSIIGVGQVQLYDGTYALVAGNGDLITEISSYIDINVRDLTRWLEDNGSNSSYFLVDYDLNGDVNIKDRILWEQNNGQFSSIPNR